MFAIVKRRNLFFMLSGALVLASLAALAIFRLPLGTDFTGGTRLQIHFEQLPTMDEFETSFQEQFGTEQGERIVKVMEKDDYLITSKVLPDTEVAAFEDKLAETEWQGSVVSNSTTSASVGAVFQQRAAIAIILAFLAIILFVAFAFRKIPKGLSPWKFGMTAIITLLHDIIIIVGVFAVLGLFRSVEIDKLFVMALLTVLGFSVNDTIVIFDRIREHLKGKDKAELPELTEKALWESMRRSINTSLSTLFILGALTVVFISFESLFVFFLALSLGVVVGTYSSLFLAAPLLVAWNRK